MLMNLMKMKSGEKTKKDEKQLEYNLKEEEFFDKCNVCDFETLFGDQFKQHRKWTHLKSKQKAEIKVSTSSEKKNYVSPSQEDKLNEKPPHKAL